MTTVADSQEVPRDAGSPEGMPEENGWSLSSGGSCSITRCIDPPVAAIERNRGHRRPPYQQAYCAEHARARGVERDADDLVWTAAFLTPRERRHLRAETDPGA